MAETVSTLLVVASGVTAEGTKTALVTAAVGATTNVSEEIAFQLLSTMPSVLSET